MSDLPLSTEPLKQEINPQTEEHSPSEPAPSYTKLAMRNMVKKKGTSLKHFFLTTVGLLSFFIGLAYLTR